MFTTLVIHTVCAPEGRLCRPDNIYTDGVTGRRPGGGPAPLPLVT